MKLLYVCSDYGIPPGGTKGASVHLRSITAALTRLGHDVRMMCPLADESGTVAVPMLRLPTCSAIRKSSRHIRQWLETRGFEAAVCKELRALTYNTQAADAALKVMGDWRPDAVVERLSLFGHAGLDLAEALGVPLVVEVNALLTEEAAAFRSLEMRNLAAAIEKRILEEAGAVVTVSSPLARCIRNRGQAAGGLHVIPNGVDMDRFEARAAGDVRAALGWQDQFVIGFCGSLKRWHGVDVLIEAFERTRTELPASKLLIVGDGPSAECLRARIRGSNIEDHVEMTGAVAHEHVVDYLQAMDVAVAPFKSMDHFYFSPIKLFEYMAAGTCVVASRLGQIAEVIEHERNGLLCPPDDPRALGTLLAQACADADHRRRMAEAALADVRRSYTWARAAESLTRIIRDAGSRSKHSRNGQQRASSSPRVEVLS